MPTIEYTLTFAELSALQEGDVLRSIGSGHTYVVTRNDGGQVTAVQSITVRHPEHWVLVRRAGHVVMRGRGNDK